MARNRLRFKTLCEYHVDYFAEHSSTSSNLHWFNWLISTMSYLNICAILSVDNCFTNKSKPLDSWTNTHGFCCLHITRVDRVGKKKIKDILCKLTSWWQHYYSPSMRLNYWLRSLCTSVHIAHKDCVPTISGELPLLTERILVGSAALPLRGKRPNVIHHQMNLLPKFFTLFH